MNMRSSASWNAYLVFAAVAVSVGVAAVVLGWRSSVHNRTLLDRGTVTFGEVTSQQRRGGIRGSDDLVVTYEYTDSRGEHHVGEVSVSREAWERLDVGVSIPVTYLAENPSVHVPRHMTEGEVGRPLASALRFALGTVGVTLLLGGFARAVFGRRLTSGDQRSTPGPP